MIDPIQQHLLEEVAQLHTVPEGAYNIRANGKKAGRNTTANIDIVSKTDKDGIDIIIKPGTKNESVHIPVVLSESGLTDLVYNDFFVGDDCDVTIVAGCGIHNCGVQNSQHDGIHTFHVGKNARVHYIERHYGEGDGNGENIMNPTTVVELGEGSYMEMETTQIKGVDSTIRTTRATLGPDATLIIHEKVMTHGKQHAKSDFTVDLNGAGCHTNVISRSVARGQSVPGPHQRQRPLLWPLRVRRHHHGPGRGLRHPRGDGQLPGRPAGPRGRHRQDRRGAADQADDPGAHRKRGRGADRQRLPEVIFCFCLIEVIVCSPCSPPSSAAGWTTSP